MPTTQLQNMVDPEVLAAMISAELPNAIKFSGVAPIDTTLQGQPGSTITIPAFKYIGDAKVVAEGAPIDYELLETQTAQHEIKKIAKGVEITDEALLSGYGDPLGEAGQQIIKSIASEVDNQTLAAIKTGTLSVSAETKEIFDKIDETFNDENNEGGVLFVSPKTAIALRNAYTESYTRASDLGDNVLVTGNFGEILGWEIVRSRKVADDEAFAVKAGALKTYLKRAAMVETDRDITRKVTQLTGDQHFVVALYDDSKVVKVEVSDTPTP